MLSPINYDCLMLSDCHIGSYWILFLYRLLYSFHYLNKLRFHLDSGSEIALPEVNKETFKLAAFLAHQTTLEAVETTTDNAYLLAIYPGRDLLIAVVFHIVGLLDGILELLKILGSHTHCLKLLATTHIAVLQQFHLADDGVKFFPGLMDKGRACRE